MQHVARHFRQQFVGYIALFIALGGISYAAIKLPDNSVGTSQLKAHAVTKSKLAHSVVDTLRGRTGSRGPKGERGIPGLQGPGATKLVYDAHATAAPTYRPIGNMGPYSLKASCSLDTAQPPNLTLTITYTGPTSTVDGPTYTDNVLGYNITQLPAATDGTFATLTQAQGGSHHSGATSTYLPTSGQAFMALINYSINAEVNTCHFSAAVTPLS